MAYGRGIYEMLTLSPETGEQMSCFGTLRCRSVSRLGVLVAIALLAGCNTVQKTLDFSADPRLEANKDYPNINVAGPTPKGKLLTPEEQAATKKALDAKAAALKAPAAAQAKAEGAASAEELQSLAKSHGEQTIEEIQGRCTDGSDADATKCPQ